MKKIVLLLSLLFIVSACSVNNDEPNFHYELLPIEEVELPTEFVMGETYQIKVWYYKPSTCYSFGGFYYEKNLNERTIAIQSVVLDSETCQTVTDELKSATLDFYVTNNGSYVFKFWQGVDENLENIFYEVEVPVVN
ncbi:membrane lipoprotein lipid attachment site-containing protein [Flavobacterium sediminis]|nr:membrane lipoprotein lipid attachment site-containing protein [Flavobacterium sediminis]